MRKSNFHGIMCKWLQGRGSISQNMNEGIEKHVILTCLNSPAGWMKLISESKAESRRPASLKSKEIRARVRASAMASRGVSEARTCG